MLGFRMLALVTALLTAARIVYYRMLGWPDLQGWPEVCAMIGALLLFWIATQRMRRAVEVQATALLGSVLLLVHELPFVSVMLNGFLQTDHAWAELLATVPMALCLLLALLSLRGIVSEVR